jgi:chloramphenicol-sensitive protein RarD
MNRKKTGILYALSSYFIWGFTPIYWSIFSGINSLEILSHRIFWACILTCIFFAATGRLGEFGSVLKDRKRMGWIVLRALLLAVNWYTYVWAVSHGRILEASLGYYLNPLVSIFLGLIFLQERLNKMQWVAVGFAVAGVALKTIIVGTFPVVSIVLAFSFGIYGLMKKTSTEGSIIGIASETLVLLPFATAFILFSELSGPASFIEAALWMKLAFVSAGIITVVPLFLFSKGTSRIPLSWIGFLQFIAPTMMMIFGLFIYHEALPLVELIGFTVVWIGLVIFIFSFKKAD